MIKMSQWLRTGVAAVGVTAALVVPTVAAAGAAQASTTKPAISTAAVAPAAVQALGTHAFHPRGSYGKADGTAHWGGHVRGSITVTGKLTDYRHNTSNSFLYMSWHAVGHRYNVQVAGASNGHTVDFRRTYHFAGAPGGIQLTVCSQSAGHWRCGVPFRV